MILKVGKYKSISTMYHWVSPQWDNTDWEDHSEICDEIWKWCTETFGPPGAWSTRTWMAGDNKYYFVKESDRVLFILRWA